MVIVKCSKCGYPLIDTKNKKLYATKYYKYQLKPSEIGFNLILEEEIELICNNCSKRYPISAIKHKLSKRKKLLKEVMEVIDE